LNKMNVQNNSKSQWQQQFKNGGSIPYQII
jgi:hypothetical protein